MYSIIRSVLFKVDPERAHHLALTCLQLLHRYRLVGRCWPTPASQRSLSVMGLSFPNPVGLAAGFDKNGDYIDALGALGFGFVEVGTVTPKAQSGQTKPRLFRLPAQRALINRMGFNNKGVDYLVSRLKQRTFPGVVGVNIGKNLTTPLAEAWQDYRYAFQAVYPYADYITVNVSSPNTPGLRSLQQGEAFDHLLKNLRALKMQLYQQTGRCVPWVVKIDPDLDQAALMAMVNSLLRYRPDAVIATNTTLDRSQLMQVSGALPEGGLSGAPLYQRSNTVIRTLLSALAGAVPVIGVGGILSAADAKEKLSLGCALVQLYTGLIYHGPGLIKSILQQLHADSS